MKTKILLVTLLVFLLALFTVNADVQVEVGGSNNEVTIQNPVERSNPEAARDRRLLDDRDDLSYARFTIPVRVQNGTINITGISVDPQSQFTYDEFGRDKSEDDIVRIVTNLEQPISVTNRTQNVVVDILVPSNLDAIDSNFDEILYTLPATIQTSHGNKDVELRFTVENNLELVEIDFFTPRDQFRCFVDDQFVRTLDCDIEIEELIPGENFDAELKILNRFFRDSRLDFDDITIRIDSSERDVRVPSRIRESLRADEERSILIDFDVNDRIRSGRSSTITITAEVTDSNGALHGFEHEFIIRFERPDWDLRVTELNMRPETVCQGEVSTINFAVENFGAREQPNVRI
ncbi:MAG: hypothetical protein ACMXYA_03725, partial [Candidatus Woesearchaeota archaeon]